MDVRLSELAERHPDLTLREMSDLLGAFGVEIAAVRLIDKTDPPPALAV